MSSDLGTSRRWSFVLAAVFVCFMKNAQTAVNLLRQQCKKPTLAETLMVAEILIAVDILSSNTAESEKTNKLFDDPERDVH